MRLKDCRKGVSYTVSDIRVPDASKHRLEVLGMVNGTEIKIMTRKRSSAMVIKVRGSRFAIGREFAEGIFVNEEATV